MAGKIIISENELKDIIFRSIKNYLLEKKNNDFFEKHGIEEIECGLGWSEKEQKYYGWSHRAIYGFGIGSKCKKGDVGYNGKEWTAKTLDDAKKMAIDFMNAIS